MQEVRKVSSFAKNLAEASSFKQVSSLLHTQQEGDNLCRGNINSVPFIALCFLGRLPEQLKFRSATIRQHAVLRTDMNIDDSVLYASAALFVLACYSLSIESGCERRVGAQDGAWGVPLEVIADAITIRKDRTSSGWGWPLVGPGGVCDRVFRYLCTAPCCLPCNSSSVHSS